MADLVIIAIGGFLIYKACRISVGLALILALLIVGIIVYRKFAVLCTMIAMRNYTTGKKGKAFLWFERAFNKGMTYQQKVTYAYYLLREGRTEKAEQIYNSMLAFGGIKPEDKKYIKTNQAILYLKTGRLDEAIEIWEELFPTYKNTSIYGSLGYGYILQGDMEKAEAFCREAYEFNSDNNVILDNMIQIHTKKGEFSEAEKYADELLAKNPNFIEGFYDIAVVFSNLGRIDEAKECLNKALAIEPSFLTNISHEMVNELLAKL
ncbi:MAG: tetratricopeptide repeat protein [Clostridia bacterium]|nr:tetratricopeptide repeat protein [Clostridia bacterium]